MIKAFGDGSKNNVTQLILFFTRRQFLSFVGYPGEPGTGISFIELAMPVEVATITPEY
jgi:hypothetical protein